MLARLLDDDPYNPEVLRLLAQSLGWLGETELAQKTVDRYALVFGDTPHARPHRGMFLEKFAWDADPQPSGYPGLKENPNLFAERLDQARDEFEKLWEEEPLCWWAPRELISLSFGLDVTPDYVKERLDEVLSICPTDADAYRWTAHYLKWRASREETLQFARECAKTGSYQTGIPSVIVNVHENRWGLLFGQDRVNYIRDPEVWDDLLPYFQKTLAESPRNYRDISYYLLFTYWRGQDKEAFGRLVQMTMRETDGRTWLSYDRHVMSTERFREIARQAAQM